MDGIFFVLFVGTYLYVSPAYLYVSAAYFYVSPAYLYVSPAYLYVSPAYLYVSPAYLYVSPAYAGLFDLRLGCLCIYFHLSVAFIRFMIANNYSCSGIAFLCEHMRTIDRGSFSKNRVIYIT